MFSEVRPQSQLPLVVVIFISIRTVTSLVQPRVSAGQDSSYKTIVHDGLEGSRTLVRTARSTDEGNLSEDEIREIVAGHNDYRRQEGASDMEYMTWNAELARMATDYVRQCVWGHSSFGRRGYNISYSSVGENLQYTSGGRNISAALVMWYREKADYDYDTRNCTLGRMCGHYTQLVWAKSKEVGCGITICSNFSKGGDVVRNIRFFGCNYGPRGNYRGAAPYKKGPACTQCTSGQTSCKTGLCYHECPDTDPGCPGYTTSNLPITSSTQMSSSSSTQMSSSSSIQMSSSSSLSSSDTSSTTATLTTSTITINCETNACQHESTPVLKDSICVCNCSNDYRGENCQFTKAEDQFGAMINLLGNVSTWSLAWRALQTQIPASVNLYCRDNPKLCCGKDASQGSGSFLTSSQLVLGSGYPYSDPGGRGTFVVLVLARHDPQNTFCQYETGGPTTGVYISREILFNGIMYEKTRLTEVLGECCELSLLTLGPSPGSLPVTRDPRGMAVWEKALLGLGVVVAAIAVLSILLFRFRRRQKLDRKANLQVVYTAESQCQIKEKPSEKEKYGQESSVLAKEEVVKQGSNAKAQSQNFGDEENIGLSKSSGCDREAVTSESEDGEKGLDISGVNHSEASPNGGSEMTNVAKLVSRYSQLDGGVKNGAL